MMKQDRSAYLNVLLDKLVASHGDMLFTSSGGCSDFVVDGILCGDKNDKILNNQIVVFAHNNK